MKNETIRIYENTQVSCGRDETRLENTEEGKAINETRMGWGTQSFQHTNRRRNVE